MRLSWHVRLVSERPRCPNATNSAWWRAGHLWLDTRTQTECLEEDIIALVSAKSKGSEHILRTASRRGKENAASEKKEFVFRPMFTIRKRAKKNQLALMSLMKGLILLIEGTQARGLGQGTRFVTVGIS